jgi:hypothetical protein
MLGAQAAARAGGRRRGSIAAEGVRHRDERRLTIAGSASWWLRRAAGSSGVAPIASVWEFQRYPLGSRRSPAPLAQASTMRAFGESCPCICPKRVGGPVRLLGETLRLQGVLEG